MPSADSNLSISSVAFANFRNYRSLHLDDIGKLTIFVGRNAIGKTNILEGIQLLTSAQSFRHPQIVQLIREGEREARIALAAGDGNRDLSIALSLEAGKRRYSVNGKGKATADVRGLLPAIMFTPDDLQLAKKSSGVKRIALDDLGVQLTRNYHVVRHDYEKCIRYKNRLLREGADRLLVQSINETLVTCAAQLYCLRRALFDRLVVQVTRIYGELSSDGEEFSAVYTPSWLREGTGLEGGAGERAGSAFRRMSALAGEKENGRPAVSDVREALYDMLEFFLDEETRRGRSLLGPHHDEIEFQLGRRDASQYASQGQQRSIVLAWKLAEVEVTKEVLGVHPVLLLDDVLSELDGSRRDMLVRFVTDDIQTFITATDLAGFSEGLLERAAIIELPIDRDG